MRAFAVVFTCVMFSLFFANSSLAFTNTWTCSYGLTCGRECNQNPYQPMWEGSASTSGYSYSFATTQAGRYTCTLTIRTSSFSDSETNEVTDLYLNNKLIGSTSDECCPQGCGTETLPNPIEFEVDPGFYDNNGGGIFVHDLDGDGLMDFVLTSEQANKIGWLAAYDHWGNKLWSKTGVKMFNYMHHPSAIAGDMDGDGRQEVAYLKRTTNANIDNIVIADGATGVQEKTVTTGASLNGQPVAGMGIVNLRGLGDRDVVVQYRRSDNKDPLKAINLETGAVLWTNNNYISAEHSLFRQADMDGDGKDDIAGIILLDENGNKMHTWDLSDIGANKYTIDSIVIADVYTPDVPYPKLAECNNNYDCRDKDQCSPDGTCCSPTCTPCVIHYCDQGTCRVMEPTGKPVFKVAPSTCAVNQDCTFKVVSDSPYQGAEIRYHFSWGDSTSEWAGYFIEGTEITVRHQYKQTGSFTVTVYAEDLGCIESQRTQHTVQVTGTDLAGLDYDPLQDNYVSISFSGPEGDPEGKRISFQSATNPLEVILAETAGAGSRTIVVNRDRIVMAPLNPWNYDDPDKLAVGNFRTNRPGLEIFARSSGSDGTCDRASVSPNELCPWVNDAQGNVINKYYLYDVPTRPSWWSVNGIDEVVRIDWNGDYRDEIVGKERHKYVDGVWRYGSVAILDAVTGAFEKVFPSDLKAMRVYAADILGDYREEVIVVECTNEVCYDNSGSPTKVKIFWNSQPNTYSKPSYWDKQYYRRQKQNWNYYSP